MRDDRIYAMHEANVRRVFLLLRQFEFLQTKIQAYEEIMASGWRTRLMALLGWGQIKRLIDNRQIELLAQRKDEENKVRAMPSIIKVAGNGNG